jgi:hypothetical protein
MQVVMAGFDKVDPAYPCLLTVLPAHDGQAGLQPYRENAACDLDREIPVAGEYAWHRRMGMAGKVRVLTS